MIRYDFSRRNESMARMPNGRKDRSFPASTRASKIAFWYSMPWWISQPSSPTKLTRSSLHGARPTVAFCPESQGKASFERSASHTRPSNSRAFGPATTSTPRVDVRSSNRTEPSAGIQRFSQSWSSR